MKILIVSAEVWRNERNGGNVLSNLFSGIDAEFAQIYCNHGTPNNELCKLYYQITDKMVLQSFFKKVKVGRKLEFSDYPSDFQEEYVIEQENKRFYGFFRKFSFEIFHIAKETLWLLSKWNNKDLSDFIKDFNPDVVFAPCYGSHFMLKLNRYVADLTQKPMISYISDDHYTMNQFRISPLFWLNRLFLRANIRKTFPKYNLIYTMTQEQKQTYEKQLNCKMKILKKSGCFVDDKVRKFVHSPIRMIYAGGIYCGRDNTLVKLVKAIKVINSNGIKFVLDIYTGNQTSKKNQKILNDKKNSFMHSVISKEELDKKYAEADIALHVESFRLKYKKMTQLSFSTKIMDCLESGAAIMAIADKSQAGLHYISENDLGFCITDLKNISETLENIAKNPELILNYSKKACAFGKQNHNKETIAKELEYDFVNI